MNDKYCNGCSQIKPTSDFTLRKNGVTPYSRCKDCNIKALKEWRSNNPEKARETHRRNAKRWRLNNPESHKNIALKAKYGITLKEYNIMIENQHGLCIICKELPDSKSHKVSPNYEFSNGKVLHIDHDHKCCPGKKSCGKCIRGLLCRTCNLMIGYAQEDILLLERAIDYLKNNVKASSIDP